MRFCSLASTTSNATRVLEPLKKKCQVVQARKWIPDGRTAAGQAQAATKAPPAPPAAAEHPMGTPAASSAAPQSKAAADAATVAGARSGALLPDEAEEPHAGAAGLGSEAMVQHAGEAEQKGGQGRPALQAPADSHSSEVGSGGASFNANS